MRFEYAGESIKDNISDVTLDGRDWRTLRRALSVDVDVEVESEVGGWVEDDAGAGSGEDLISFGAELGPKSGELREYGTEGFCRDDGCDVRSSRDDSAEGGNGKGRCEPIPILA